MGREIVIRHRNWIISVRCPGDDPGAWGASLDAAKAAVEAQDRAALAGAGGRLIEVAEETAAVLGGTLCRDIVGRWRWSDGAPEPRARDLFLRETWPNYRCRPAGDGATLVEVPENDLRGDTRLARALAWCRAAAAGRDLSGDHVGMRVLHGDGRMTRAYSDPASGETTGARAIPEVLLVPMEEWHRRGLAVCGAQWDRAHDDAILAAARALGWDGR